MDISLNSLIIEICKEYGANPEFGNRIVQKLNDQFYFRLGDFANMNFELWKELELPINLFFILQEKYNQTKNKLHISVPTGMTTTIKQENIIQSMQRKEEEKINLVPKEEKIIKQVLNEDIKKPSIQKESDKIDEKPKPQQQTEKKENLEYYLESIITELKVDKDSSKLEVLKKLHTVVSNIAGNPLEEKFKKLKINSKFYTDFLQPYNSVMNFLYYIGFSKSLDNEFLEYKGRAEHIQNVLLGFNQFLIKNKIVQTDPYSSSIISTGTQVSELKKVLPKEDLGDLLRQEKQRREEIVRSSKTVDRKPKIFQIEDGNMNSLIRNLLQEEESDAPKNEDQEFFKKAMASINENNERFVLRTRTELENLIKKPIYTKATIRVKFPNELIFQGNFAMMETIQDVSSTIKEILKDPHEPFYLFIPFPKKLLTDPKATIYSQDLAPSTMVYISFNNIDPIKNPNYEYIKSECIEKYKTEYKF